MRCRGVLTPERPTGNSFVDPPPAGRRRAGQRTSSTHCEHTFHGTRAVCGADAARKHAGADEHEEVIWYGMVVPADINVYCYLVWVSAHSSCLLPAGYRAEVWPSRTRFRCHGRFVTGPGAATSPLVWMTALLTLLATPTEVCTYRTRCHEAP